MQAYEQHIFYPRYIFLLYGWYEDQWWLEQENENLPCTAEQREMVLSNSLAVVQDERISDCSRTAKTGIVRLSVMSPTPRPFPAFHFSVQL